MSMSMSMSMSSLMSSKAMKAMEGIYRECGVEIVNLINKKYGMDVKLEELLLSSSLSSLSEERELVSSSSSFPIPFNKNNVKPELCQGLCYNHGLFTQCPKKRVSESCEYCKGCSKEAEKSNTGKPNCGTIEARLSTGLMEYTDSKGRKPIAYRKVLEKQNISIETVKEMASKENIEIDSIHFEETEQKRGRPKTKIAKQVEAATVEDLFATLVNEELENVESINSTVVMSGSDEEEIKEAADKEPKKTEKVADKEAKLKEKAADKEAKLKEKAADKEAKLKEKAADKEAKEAKLAADKAAKEAKLAADKAAKEAKLAADKAAKEAKLAAEKAAKEEKLAADKAAKEAKLAADKEAKLAADKEAKEAKLKEKEAKLAAKEAPKEKVVKEKVQKEKVVKESKKEEVQKESKKEEVQKESKTEEAEEAPVKVTVKRITIDGKEYFKTSANILYDPETKEEVGLYDAETNSIKELPDDSDDELQEDEYDSDNQMQYVVCSMQYVVCSMQLVLNKY